jgi:hypothetical protein
MGVPTHCSRRFSASRSLPSVLTQRLPTVGTCASARVTRIGGLRDGWAFTRGISIFSIAASVCNFTPAVQAAGRLLAVEQY